VLAVFHSDLPLDEVIQKLKMIEFAMGRQPRDKDAGKVIIDIDLLQYGDEIVRPDDYERAYVQSLLTQLIS
jgi:2-amino-4-hydroxy-6-hydroxymethyldihydropteridine diphosphokinase